MLSFTLFEILVPSLDIQVATIIKKDSSEETAIYSSYVGNWYDSKDDTKVMTVNSDGSITIDGIGKITNITKKSDTKCRLSSASACCSEHDLQVSGCFYGQDCNL